MYSWSSWHTLVPLLVGVAGLSLTALYEKWLSTRYTAKAQEPKDLKVDTQKVITVTEPLVPSSIFRNVTMYVLYFHTVIHGILLWSLLYFLPLYYEAIKEYSPLISGVAVLPETGLIARKCFPMPLIATQRSLAMRILHSPSTIYSGGPYNRYSGL